MSSTVCPWDLSLGFALLYSFLFGCEVTREDEVAMQVAEQESVEAVVVIGPCSLSQFKLVQEATEVGLNIYMC